MPEVAGLCARGNEISDHVVESRLGSGDVLTSMQKRRESSVMVPAMLVGYERIGLEYSFESVAGLAGLISDLGEILEVGSRLTFVPG